MSNLRYWEVGEEGMTELVNLGTVKQFFQAPVAGYLPSPSPQINQS